MCPWTVILKHSNTVHLKYVVYAIPQVSCKTEGMVTIHTVCGFLAADTCECFGTQHKILNICIHWGESYYGHSVLSESSWKILTIEELWAKWWSLVLVSHSTWHSLVASHSEVLFKLLSVAIGCFLLWACLNLKGFWGLINYLGCGICFRIAWDTTACVLVKDFLS